MEQSVNKTTAELAQIKGIGNALKLFFPEPSVALVNAEALVDIMEDGIEGARALVLSTWTKAKDGNWHMTNVVTGELHMVHQIVHMAMQYSQYGYKFRQTKDGTIEFRHLDGTWDLLVTSAMNAHGDNMTSMEFEAAKNRNSPVAKANGNVGFAMAPSQFEEDGTWSAEPWTDIDGVQHLLLHGLNFRFLFATSVADSERKQLVKENMGRLLRLMNESAGQQNLSSSKRTPGPYGNFTDYRGVAIRQRTALNSLLFSWETRTNSDGETGEVFVPGSIMTQLLGSKSGLLYSLNGPRREGGCFLKAAYDRCLAPDECLVSQRTANVLKGTSLEPEVGDVLMVGKNPDMRRFPLTIVGFSNDHSIHVSPLVGPRIAADGDGDTLGVMFTSHAKDMLKDILSIPQDAAFSVEHEPGIPAKFLGLGEEEDRKRILESVKTSVTSKLLMAPSVALRATVGMIDCLKEVAGQSVLNFLSVNNWSVLDSVNAECETEFTEEQCRDWVENHGGVVLVPQEVSRCLAEVAINKHETSVCIAGVVGLMDLAVFNTVAAFKNVSVLAKFCKHLDMLMGLAAIKVAMNGQLVSEALKLVPKGRKLFMSSLVWSNSGQNILDAFEMGIDYDKSNACVIAPGNGGPSIKPTIRNKSVAKVSDTNAKFSASVSQRVSKEITIEQGQEALDCRYAMKAIAQAINGTVEYIRDANGKVTASILAKDGKTVASGIPYRVTSSINAVFTSQVHVMRSMCTECGTFITTTDIGTTCACGKAKHAFSMKAVTAGEYLAYRTVESLGSMLPGMTAKYQALADPDGSNRGRDIHNTIKGFANRLFIEPGTGERTMRQNGFSVGRVVLDISTDVPYELGSMHPAEHTVDVICSALEQLADAGVCIAGTSTSKPGTTAALGTDGIPEMIRLLVVDHNSIDPARFAIVNSALSRTRKLTTGTRQWFVAPQAIHPETVVGLTAYHDLDDGLTDLEQIAVAEGMAGTISYPCNEQVLVPVGTKLNVKNGDTFTGNREVAEGCWYTVSEYAAPVHTVEIVGVIGNDNIAVTSVKILVHTTRCMINEDGSWTEGKWVDLYGNKGMTRRMSRKFSTVLMGETLPIDVVMNASRMCGEWTLNDDGTKTWVENGKMKTGGALTSAILSQVAFYRNKCQGMALPMIVSPDMDFSTALNMLEDTIREFVDSDAADADVDYANLLREKLCRIDTAMEGTDSNENELLSAKYRLAFLPMYETLEDGTMVTTKDEVLMGFMPFLIQPLDVHQESTNPISDPDFRILREVDGQPVLNLKPMDSRSGFSLRKEYDYHSLTEELREFFFSAEQIKKYDPARVWLGEQLLKVLFQKTVSMTGLDPVEYPHWIDATGEGLSFDEDSSVVEHNELLSAAQQYALETRKARQVGQAGQADQVGQACVTAPQNVPEIIDELEPIEDYDYSYYEE